MASCNVSIKLKKLVAKFDLSRLYFSIYFYPAACKATIDLAFLVDGSNSINFMGPGRFRKELHFVKKMISAFEIARNETHVGLIVYSSNASLVLGFDDHYDKPSIVQAIDNVQYPKGGKNAGAGLLMAGTELFKASARQGVPSLLLVLMGSSSQDDVRKPSRDLHNMGVKVFGIGVGETFDQAQLNEIATDPDSEYVYTAGFDELDNIIGKIQYKACLGEIHVFASIYLHNVKQGPLCRTSNGIILRRHCSL